MFDIGWQEIFIIAVLALLVVGPKELPRGLKTVTQLIRRARQMARDFQTGIDDIVRESDVQELRQSIESTANADLKDQFMDAVDPDGDVTKEMNLDDDFDAVSSAFDEDDRDGAGGDAFTNVETPDPDPEPVLVSGDDGDEAAPDNSREKASG